MSLQSRSVATSLARPRAVGPSDLEAGAQEELAPDVELPQPQQCAALVLRNVIDSETAHLGAPHFPLSSLRWLWHIDLTGGVSISRTTGGSGSSRLFAEGLKYLEVLGRLDISASSFSVDEIKPILVSMVILDFRCAHSTLSRAHGSDRSRLVAALPRMWSLDGIYCSIPERIYSPSPGSETKSARERALDAAFSRQLLLNRDLSDEEAALRHPQAMHILRNFSRDPPVSAFADRRRLRYLFDTWTADAPVRAAAHHAAFPPTFSGLSTDGMQQPPLPGPISALCSSCKAGALIDLIIALYLSIFFPVTRGCSLLFLRGGDMQQSSAAALETVLAALLPETSAQCVPFLSQCPPWLRLSWICELVSCMNSRCMRHPFDLLFQADETNDAACRLLASFEASLVARMSATLQPIVDSHLQAVETFLDTAAVQSPRKFWKAARQHRPHGTHSEALLASIVPECELLLASFEQYDSRESLKEQRQEKEEEKKKWEPEVTRPASSAASSTQTTAAAAPLFTAVLDGVSQWMKAGVASSPPRAGRRNLAQVLQSRTSNPQLVVGLRLSKPRPALPAVSIVEPTPPPRTLRGAAAAATGGGSVAHRIYGEIKALDLIRSRASAASGTAVPTATITSRTSSESESQHGDIDHAAATSAEAQHSPSAIPAADGSKAVLSPRPSRAAVLTEKDVSASPRRRSSKQPLLSSQARSLLLQLDLAHEKAYQMVVRRSDGPAAQRGKNKDGGTRRKKRATDMGASPVVHRKRSLSPMVRQWSASSHYGGGGGGGGSSVFLLSSPPIVALSTDVAGKSMGGRSRVAEFQQQLSALPQQMMPQPPPKKSLSRLSHRSSAGSRSLSFRPEDILGEGDLDALLAAEVEGNVPDDSDDDEEDDGDEDVQYYVREDEGPLLAVEAEQTQPLPAAQIPRLRLPQIPSVHEPAYASYRRRNPWYPVTPRVPF